MPKPLQDPSAQFMKVPSFGALEFSDCGLCGESKWTLVTRQRGFGEDFQVVRCQGCDLIRTNPRPTPEWKDHFYNPDYNGYAESQGRDFVYAPDLTRRVGYRRLLDFLRPDLPPSASLLDVGCASGLFVKEAVDRGIDAFGCDYSEEAIAYGRKHFNIQMFRSPAEAIDAPDNHYDVITLLQVFEHLPDPMRVLRELKRVLKPGGMLVLETVNYLPHYKMETDLRFMIPVYNAVTRRPSLPWLPFDHLYHWSPKTIKRAAIAAEFRDVKLHHLMGYRSEMKPTLGFSVAYTACELVGRGLIAASGGRWDYWPVLLATCRK